ncbi:MAG: PKD domain-containing protein, partial [Myxococcota bacterium]|nr:PKD domain-containing protein [Myxococcota bacterium]
MKPLSSSLRRSLSLRIPCLLIPIMIASVAYAADPEVIVVPYSPQDTRLPHPVHERGHITLKAMLREANCGNGYQVVWDTDRDGVFEPNQDSTRDVSPSGGVVRDIGLTYLLPDVSRDQNFPINVRVTNRCTGREAFSTYRMFIYDWHPSSNPRNWTADQIDVMSQMGIQEGLWNLHRGLTSLGGSGAQIRGVTATAGRNPHAGNALGIWAFVINGRLPAYPPGSIETFGHALPAGWAAKNDARWEVDPYAETSMRMINNVLNRGTGNQWVNSSDEGSNCRFTVRNNGTVQEQACNRLAGTANNNGAYTNGVSNNTYYQGVNLGSLAPVLSALAGTRLQVGGLRGTLWEVFIQEMTDFMAYMQIDSGGGLGGWYYSAYNGSGSEHVMDASTAQWGYIGLESAEVAGRPYGVIVSNKHKFRSAYAVARNHRTGSRGGSCYRTSGSHCNNLMLTGGSFVVARWLDWDSLPNAGGDLYGHGTGYSANNYKNTLSAMRSWTSSYWSSSSGGGHSARRLWTTGNYLCGQSSGVYRTSNSFNCTNLYGLYSHQKGYRTGSPEEPSPQLVDGFNWDQQFSISVLRSQYRSLGSYGDFGRIHDCGYSDSQIVCNYGGESFATAVGILVLTPTIFNPKPVAIGSRTPARVTEGCAGGNNGLVTFDHSASFHPNPDTSIDCFQWDVDFNGNQSSLWWNTQSGVVGCNGRRLDNGNRVNNYNPDFEIGTTYRDPNGNERQGRLLNFEHRYMYARSNGQPYTATLRLVDGTGQLQETSVQIQVDRSPDQPPEVAHGGPYVIEEGETLLLNGVASDPNQGCLHSRLQTVGWDIDDDGAYDDLNQAAGQISWNQISHLARGVPHTIRIRATDESGSQANGITQFTIYPRDPVARASVLPNPAACQQEITFDASASNHPNPARRIETYEWDIDANRNLGFDGGGANPVFRYTYNRYGDYAVRLRVTDDLGRQHEVDGITVNVNQGNNAPIARVLQPRMELVERRALVLDASPSFDSNLACGDRIVSYAWDFNGDGVPELSVPDARIELPWEQVVPLIGWDGVAAVIERRITLTVTDSFGANTNAALQLTVFKADPVAHFDQIPDPAAIDEVTGRVDVVLDARESFSPIPGGSIVRYEWDLNEDGVFGDGGGQSVLTFRRIYENPNPAAVPRPTVRLRVTDARGGTKVFERAIEYRVGDAEPTADADPSDAPELGYHILLGDPLVLSAAQSIEPNPNDHIRHYRWRLDFDEDRGDDPAAGIWDYELEDGDADGAEADLVIPPAELDARGLNELGTWGLLLEVEDTTFLSAQDRSTVTVHPIDPIAAGNINPSISACGQRVTLDASACAHPHPQIDVMSWRWDIGGNGRYDDPEDMRGEVVTMMTNNFTFNGPMTIGLLVTDSRGNTNEMAMELRVDQGNSPPLANAGGPYFVAVGDPGVLIDGSQSNEPDADCGDEIVSRRWDIGNNGSFEAAYDDRESFSLSWAELTNLLGTNEFGAYEILLETRDRFGTVGRHVTTIELLRGPTARAEIAPARATCNALVSFDGGGSSSDGPAGAGFAIVRYEWDLDGDGVFEAEGQTVNRNALEQGLQNVTLRVTDASGRIDLDTVPFEVVVNNVPPVSNVGGPYTAGVVNRTPVPIDLDGRGSSDPNEPCDTLTLYQWDTDNDGLYGREDTNGAGDLHGSDYEGELVRNYSFSGWNPGLSYQVRLRVCDERTRFDGAGRVTNEADSCNISETEITVLDNAPPVGELLSPRSDQCVSTLQSQLRFRVRDLEGGRIEYTILVDGEAFDQGSINVAADTMTEGSHVIDASRFAQGSHDIRVRFQDQNRATSTVSAGGLVVFDREAPTLSISNRLFPNACYAPNEVPDPEISIFDTIDQAPIVDQTLTENHCERILRVVGRDSCGNERDVTRVYRVATPVDVELAAPAEGALVGPTSITWSLNSPPSCAGEISSMLSSNGQERFYVSGSPIEEPGQYTHTLDVPNCIGESRLYRLAFSVNGAPEAVPVANGHPNADNLAQIPTYRSTEGSELRLDASDSRPPERQDQIVLARWDLDGTGRDVREGLQIDYPTNDDGIFTGSLLVADSFDLRDDEVFQVIIEDVDPTADPGGPYNGIQG